ncbi:putative lysophospholipase L1 biosynthesis ABC-type transport system permease subunit [Amorphus suaedae]
MELEIRELRQEARKAFGEFRKALMPLVTMALANKMLLALMVAGITAAGVLFAIADRVWAWTAERSVAISSLTCRLSLVSTQPQ